MCLAAVVSLLATACNRVPVETPPDFAFLFKSQFAGVYTLNTFNKTFRRTTKSTGDTTIVLQLKKSQLDSVYTFMRGIDFFSLPEYLEPEGAVTDFPSPWSTFSVRANGVIKRISFGGSYTSGVSATQNLRRLSKLIIEMITNSPEYRYLPQSGVGLPQVANQ
jgi:hypothetical protein